MNDLTADRWQRIDDLFAEALARDPDARTAYLRAACGHDPALYAEVAALLDSAADAAEALGESLAAYAEPLLHTAEDDGAPDDGLAPGARLGPYRIEGEAGRGGMGVVYRATRADGAFEKAVALKLVKRGMDTDEVLARFRRERQVLAGLDHPAIARLLDGGAAADGRPYLVMEYVEGAPITAYAAARRLDLDARLALFEGACEAVQHAHRRLVVHRDLKPSNVLVTEDEAGAPRVKLLDFGVAKLLAPGADEALTRVGGGALTPAYAAPEQLRGAAVTTATDVYALGVVLHELLVHTRPEAPGRPPSAAVTAAAAAAGGTTPERLRRRLKGDLDTIVLKALREEPAERYPSVESLLDDLRRYRVGLPVSARPATVGYRVRRFVRRNRAGMAAAALVVLALVGGLGAALWQAGLAARERDEAEVIAGFLEDLLASPDPMAAERLDTLRVRELLVRGTAQVQTELEDRPLLQARMLHVLGQTYRRMELFGEAEALLEDALALRRAHLGEDHEDTARTLHELSWAQGEQHGYQAVEAPLREVVAVYRRRLGERHPETAMAMVHLAGALGGVGDTAGAEGLLRDALEILRATRGARSSEAAYVMTHLANVLVAVGETDEAVALHREADAIQRERYGEDHPVPAGARINFAFVLLQAGQPAEAEAQARAGLAVFRTAYGDTSHSVHMALTVLASALRAQQRDAEAEAALREAVVFTNTKPMNRAIALGTLATLLRERGALAEAADVQGQAVAILTAEGAGGHNPVLAFSIAKLADLLVAQGRYVEGERVLRDGLQTLRGAHAPEDSGPQLLARRMVALQEAWGRPHEAARYGALVRPAEAGAPHPR